MLVELAAAAEPGVLIGKLLWRHELSEAVINSDLVVVGKEGAGQPCGRSLWEDSGENL